MKFETVPEQTLLDRMPEIGPILQLAFLGALALFLIWRVRRLTAHGRATPCRWKKDRGRRTGMTRWQCVECGVDAFSQDGRAPKECKRALREVGL